MKKTISKFTKSILITAACASLVFGVFAYVSGGNADADATTSDATLVAGPYIVGDF